MRWMIWSSSYIGYFEDVLSLQLPFCSLSCDYIIYCWWFVNSLFLAVVFRLVKLREMKMCSYCAPLLHYITRSRCIPTVILTQIHTSEWTVGLCGAVVMRYVGSWGVKSSSGLLQRQQRDHHLGAKLSLISWSLNRLSHWRWTALLLYLKTHTWIQSHRHTHAHTSINTKYTHTYT